MRRVSRGGNNETVHRRRLAVVSLHLIARATKLSSLAHLINLNCERETFHGYKKLVI